VRVIHLVPAAIIAPFVMFYLTRTITGEPLSAVVLTLLMFVMVAAMFARAEPSGARRHR